MINPHGGKLIERQIPEDKREKTLEEVKEFYQISINPEQAQEIENIAMGVFSPLEGFLTQNEYASVLEHSRLSNDVPWTIPILLDVSDSDAKAVTTGDAIALNAPSGPAAILEVEDIYQIDKKAHAQTVFGTTDEGHPGVKRTQEMQDFIIGGKINLIKTNENPHDKYYLKPKESRVLFQEMGWDKIVAFQTRNPPHVGHEYVQKAALTIVDGLLINPIIGKKKTGDFRDDVILESYKALIDNYYPKEHAVMSILKTEMRYGGPKEAIHHSIMRKNFGCTHFIVGRDHAGVGDYYGPYDAHMIFKEFPDLEIEPIFFRSFSHCKTCGGPVNDKICPHPPENHIFFKGTMVREIVSTGNIPPKEMMRPEVVDVIKSYQDPFVK
jgi:sulfate adenylyltransferase